MGKSVGFIGNFKGKLGNAVGYKVSQSNSGTNQGVRVYQPNIKNPKSAAQAEQRAKYAPIFATYRALKMIIDRGNESKPYGNASRIAWLKKAFRSSIIPWTSQGETISYPLGCQLTLGTLNHVPFNITDTVLNINVDNVTGEMTCKDVGELSTYLFEQYPFLKKGDQFTLIVCQDGGSTLQFDVRSYILDEYSIELCPGWQCSRGRITWAANDVILGASVIISREGAHGEHLRSTSFLTLNQEEMQNPPYDNATKQAAIASYMANDSANADWAEESIQ